MQRQALYFTAPNQVEVREESIPDLGTRQLLVRTAVSGISSGTELLYYRGQVPEELALDAGIPSLSGDSRYPFPYGYACAGEVIDAGTGVESTWLGKKVFSFQPHASHFCAEAEQLIELPEGMAFEQAIFLPNMETALNFVLDARPLVGEFVGVFGLGVVGLLTTALLLRFPLGGLVCWDRYPLRRQTARHLGLEFELDPDDTWGWQNVLKSFGGKGLQDGLDLALELSGAPPALDQAIGSLGFGGRLVIGSWYGTKPVHLDLGGKFHRSRIEMIASQVSTIAPVLRGRWDKDRRFSTVLRLLAEIRPETWITQRFPLERASETYRQLAEDPSSSLQVIFEY